MEGGGEINVNVLIHSQHSFPARVFDCLAYPINVSYFRYLFIHRKQLLDSTAKISLCMCAGVCVQAGGEWENKLHRWHLSLASTLVHLNLAIRRRSNYRIKTLLQSVRPFPPMLCLKFLASCSFGLDGFNSQEQTQAACSYTSSSKLRCVAQGNGT